MGPDAAAPPHSEQPELEDDRTLEQFVLDHIGQSEDLMDLQRKHQSLSPEKLATVSMSII